MAPNGNRELSGTGQADWILRYGLTTVCIREMLTEGQLIFV